MTEPEFCEAKTNAQMTGGSWASKSWSCQRKATEVVVLKGAIKGSEAHLCWQHAAMARKEGWLR